MSKYQLDSSILASSPLFLSDLSSRDKVWDIHRENSDRIQQYYADSDGEFFKYADRINHCSQFLKFGCVNSDIGELKLKLLNTKFCRVRYCPMCQWRRNRAWKAKALKVFPKVIADYPIHRFLFLTLTVKNPHIRDLRKTLEMMNLSFSKMTRRKLWPGVGWLKSTEVTKGKDNPNHAHPHFHCLLMVKSNYFGRNYMLPEDWSLLWQKCLRSDYKPNAYITALEKSESIKPLIYEVLKYATKESDLVQDKEWFLELTRQTHKMRFVSTGGVFKEYFKELENEPNHDELIGFSLDNEVTNGDYFNFKWSKHFSRYFQPN